MMPIPFSPPYIDEAVEIEVLQVLRSGWITTGLKVEAFERAISEYVGVKATLAVNSATSGMMLALHWFGVGPGDEVIIPAYTYAATALAVMHIGATPIMVDVAEDFNISVTHIEAVITERTKAIVPVDIAGWPCDYDDIYAVINKKEIKAKFLAKGIPQQQLGRILIMSDAAHSFGALYKAKHTGACADITVFSFHAVKNLTTAEGGAICLHLPAPFDNEAIYKTLRLWSLHGQTKDAFSKNKLGSWRYDVVYPGFKINLPDVLAAIGLAQIKKYDTVLLSERRRVYKHYHNAFRQYGWAQLPIYENNEKKSSGHLYPLRIREITEGQRDTIIDIISAAGVAVNVHFQPLPLLSLFKERGYDINHYPIAFDNYAREISLPVYPQLTKKQCDYIIQSVIKAVTHVMS